jgi:hypothetical protein
VGAGQPSATFNLLSENRSEGEAVMAHVDCDVAPFLWRYADRFVLFDHFIRFADQIFNLIPLADLPDEQRARQIGKETLGQNDLGPADDKVGEAGDLFSGFDNARLLGIRKPVSPAYAQIPETSITSFPHMGGKVVAC